MGEGTPNPARPGPYQRSASSAPCWEVFSCEYLPPLSRSPAWVPAPRSGRPPAQDEVGVLDREKTMGDDERRPPGKDTADGLLHRRSVFVSMLAVASSR